MKVAFRVDASRAIGTGHFMRCLALADGLRRRGAAIRFVSRRLPAHLHAMLAERAYELGSLDEASSGNGSQDAGETARALAPDPWDWLVVDHYALDARWESSLRGRAAHILAIDDLADRQHDCDVLLDQNLHADAHARYASRVPARCKLLLGPGYALLREEFRMAHAGAFLRAGRLERVLVSFGGADVGSHTGVAIEALAAAGLAWTSVDVVVGVGHPQQDAIEDACLQHGFRCHVQPACMAELMAASDLALGAGGITVWERCCVGLPSLAVPVAPNQDEVVAEAARHGLLYAPGRGTAMDAAALATHIRALADSVHLREMLSRNGLEAVDGRGVERVARVLDPGIRVREATLADAGALFEWRNHESVRSASRQPDEITRSGHDTWLRTVLADPDRLLLIGERDGTPVGVVRFDVRAGPAEVSVYRVPGAAGGGVGSALLRAAELWLRERRPEIARVTAEVLGDNEPSRRMLLANGYRLDRTVYEKRWEDRGG